MQPAELNRRIVMSTDMMATPDVRLPDRQVDRSHDLVLSGPMAPYRWTINCKTFRRRRTASVTQGEVLARRLPLRSSGALRAPGPRCSGLPATAGLGGYLITTAVFTLLLA